jgi:hypothetical protein
LVDINRISELAEELYLDKSELNCSNAVSLSTDQVEKLVLQGCSSVEWSRVKATQHSDLGLVSNCRFEGDVRIHIPAGRLSDTTFNNCSIEGPLTVRSCSAISSMTLLPDARIEFCGSVQWKSAPEVLDSCISAGVETGERDVPIIPHFDHNDVAFLGTAAGRVEADRFKFLQKEIGSRLQGVVSRGAVVSNCSCVLNSVVLAGATITNATAVRGSILMEGASVQDGALVKNSVLQWNSSVDSFAIVESSIVGECAVAERHGKLTRSFLGADSVLGEGEVTASVVGPLTGIHHQSLLIAAMWPGGCGNVGYGANIGSNHTSRLPDQEIRPGTGQFFGLSTSVKFPADFSRSPFTVVATGITTLPQRVSFPFSLITLPRKRPSDVPDGWCRLVPGWMLSDNLYSILRNQWKYGNRLKAIHTEVETTVFSEEVLEMVFDARQRLKSSSGAEVPGAGKNYITEEDRLKGIEIYRKCLRAAELWKKHNSASLSSSETGEMLDLLGYARTAAITSREKDYRRGRRIIDDYADVRTPIEEEEFMKILEAFFTGTASDLENLNPAS